MDSATPSQWEGASRRKHSTHIKETGKTLDTPLAAVEHVVCQNIQQLDKNGAGVMHERFSEH
jgi:hypothetical protein